MALALAAVLGLGAGSARATTCANATVLAYQNYPAFSIACGATNDITSANAGTCGSSLYRGGLEAVYTFTSLGSGAASFAYSGQTWSGLFLYNGCPTSGGICVANIASSAASKTLSATIATGVTYFLVIDTWPTPNSPCPGTIAITLPAPAVACSGAPNAGTASGPVTVCSGASFSLNATGLTAGSGITYQWQRSTNGGGSWSNISGATGASASVNQSANTQYRIQTTCANSGITSTSNVVSVSVGNCCNYTFRMTDTFGDGWNGATMQVRDGTTVVATIGSTFTSGFGPVDQIVQLVSGVSYNLFFNNGGSFSTECRTQIIDPFSTAIYTQTASAGVNTILTSWTAICPSPCAGLPAGGTIAPATVNSCGNTPAVLSLSGNTVAFGISYAWEESDDNGGADPWGPVVGGSGATTTTYTTAAFVGTRFFRCVVTCANSGLSAISSVSQVSQSAPCQFTVVRNTNVPYTSIFGNGGLDYSFSNISTDDGATAFTPLTGTTFTFRGQAVTGFRAGTNGWMTFNPAVTPTAFSNSLGTTTLNNALAPLWDDLICSPNDFTVTTMQNCMKYRIDGTLGSGSAKVIIEWFNMDNFAVPSTNLNFQVILDENGNTITYRYGQMLGFTGSANTPWSFSLGMNAPTFSATPSSFTEVMALRDEGTTNFAFSPATVSSSGLNGLIRLPACNSEYVFTPAAGYPGPGAPPTAPPANDEIAGAEVLTVNVGPCGDLCSTYRSSLNATATAGVPVCGAITPGTPDDDVWFRFTANAPSVSISVLSGTGNDVVVQLLDVTGTVALDCQNASGLGLTETVNATGLTPGADYLIRVYNVAVGTPANSRNDFSICVFSTPLPPTNDECATATPITPGIGCTPVFGNGFLATASAVAPCTGTADDDVWYSFVAPGTGAIVRVQSVGTYNAAFQVFSSSTNDCDNQTSIACVNSTNAGGLEQTTLSGLTPGNTYFIRVYNWAVGPANGQFTICVDAGAQCPPLSAPADGSTVITLPIQLSWSAGLFASGYDVYFDANNPPTTLVSSNQPGLTYDANGPLTNGTYYWRVQARNALGATSNCATRSVVVNLPSCLQPAALAASPISVSSLSVTWLCGFCSGNYIVEYGPVGFTPGTGASAGGGTVVTSATLGATLSGLAANTNYHIYVRQECVPGVDYSLNTGPILVKTAENLCGQSYFDSGGSAANYNNSENIVRTFCGANPGEVVSVGFNSFNTESSYDPLYIFNGPSTASPKIASANGVPFGNNVYGTGGWWGSTLPAGGTIVSSHPSGCLTFAFTSDGSVTLAGWDASVVCAPPSACTVPSGVTATGVSSTSATISWTCAGCTGTGPFTVEYGISGFTPGTGATAGAGGTVITNATSPLLLTGLAAGTTFKVYVRQDCDGAGTTFSNNSYTPATFTTGPGCGSAFYDVGGPSAAYPANLSATPDIRTICPNNPADKVIVTFSSFDVESSWDPLYVFNGTSTSSPLIASANGTPFTSPNFGAGGWWGTGAPSNTGLAGVVLATNPSGCLTFAHISDGIIQGAGWSATVACASTQYSCSTAQSINCGEVKTGFTIGGTNTLPVGGCQYNGGASTSGVSWWTFTGGVNDQDMTMTTCGTTTMNTRISVYKPMPDCSNLVCVGAVDDAPGCPNGTSEVKFLAQAGQLYYIAVHGNAANDGIFQLTALCTPNCVAPQNNDACANAVELTTYLQDGGQQLFFDDNGCSYVDGPVSCTGAGPAVGNWYSFNTGPNAKHRLYTQDSSDPPNTATALNYALYSGTCSELAASGPVVCGSDVGGTFVQFPDLALNSTYRLLLYNNGSTSQSGLYAFWVDHPAAYDAAVTAVTAPTGVICNGTLQPVITLKNFGETTLTSAILEVSLDGAAPFTTFPWTGSLVQGASTSYTLPFISVPSGQHTLTVSAKSPNGITDQIPGNNAATSSYDLTGQTLIVSVRSDANGPQMSWVVYDAFFFPLAQSPVGGLVSNQLNETTVCLPTNFGNCFSFYMFDAGGDGILNEGGWELRDGAQRTILRDNGSYGNQSPSSTPLSPLYFAHQFCLPLGPSAPLATECELYSNLLNNKVFCNTVAGATNYQFEFLDPNAGFIRRIAVPRNWVKFNEMVSTPLVFGTTYFCHVRADVGNNGFTDDFFGAGCQMALAPQQPVCTELISTPGPSFSCGVTKRFGGSDKIYAVPVPGATQYRFSFSGGLIDPDGPTGPQVATVQVRNITRTSYVNLLNWATFTLVNGQTYTVQVEAFVSGVWSGFCGAPCTVTIQNPAAQGGREEVSGIMEETVTGVSLWPNPVRDGRVNLRIDGLSGELQPIEVDVYDVFGKRVMSKHFETEATLFTQTLELNDDMAAGLYLVQIMVDGRQTTERLNVVR